MVPEGLGIGLGVRKAINSVTRLKPTDPCIAGGLIAAYLAWWTAHYRKYVAHKPRLSYLHTSYNQQVVLRCPSLRDKFEPTPWLSSTHAQTIGSVMRGLNGTLPMLQLDRELITDNSGGTVALDWQPRPCSARDTLSADAPTLIVLHGLTGGTMEPHVRMLLKMAGNNKWRAVLLNGRGCSNAPMTSPQPYTAGYTGDVFWLIDLLKKRLPNSPLLAAGVSLGASVLTKYVSEASDTADGTGLVAAASISNPMSFETTPTGQNSSRDPNLLWPYMVVLSIRMYHYMIKHWHMMKQHPKLERLKRRKLLPKFYDITHLEDMIIVPVYGYSSREEYYRDSSSINYIHRIKTPTLFFASTDDPFIRTHPERECAANPYTICALTEKGGHCGFMDGMFPFFGDTLMTRVVQEFFHANLELRCEAHAHGRHAEPNFPLSTTMTKHVGSSLGRNATHRIISSL